MIISALIKKSADQGVFLRVENGNLKFTLTVEEFPHKLKKEIIDNKQEIINFLASETSFEQHTSGKILRLKDRENVPASFAQQRLWFIDKLRGGSAEYNMPAAFNVSGRLDLVLLNRVFCTIIDRHEVLRTALVESEGMLYQKIRFTQTLPFAITLIDLTGEAENAQTQQIERLLQADIETPFDLSNDLMLRVSYIRTSDVSGVLLFNMHHIASDGWSMQVLMQEFLTLYQAYHKQQLNPLAELDIQYADYASWQHEQLNEQLGVQLEYWQQQLNGVEPLHSLPLLGPRPEIKGSKGKVLQGSLAPELHDQLLILARQYQLTLFMLLHGALSLVIGKFSYNNDVIIGTAIANRTSKQVSQLIGYFTNTIVLRTDTSNRSLSEYWGELRDMHLNAQAHQALPFDKVVEALKVHRSNSYTPLLQIIMTMQSDFNSGNEQSLTLADATLIPVHLGQVNTKFDLEVDFDTSSNGLKVCWKYDPELFTEAFIEQLNRSLENVLTWLGVSGHQASKQLSDINYLNAREREFLLSELNQSACDYPSNETVHTLFEVQAKRFPTAIAVAMGGQSVSYEMLNSKANQLSHYLLEHHIQTGDVIGIGIERSIEQLVAVLAVLKTGSAYVPLDPTYPSDTLAHLVTNSQVKVILTSGLNSRIFSEFEPVKVDIEGIVEGLHPSEGYPSTNLSERVGAICSSSLAYLIYTSGTTSKPKGVMIEHRALVNTIVDNARTIGLNSSTVIYQATSFNFDAATWVFFVALSTGAKVRLASSLDFDRDLKDHPDVTHLMMTPSMLQSVSPSSLPELSTVIVAGEACSPSLLATWAKGDVAFFNAYGPTEAAICCSIAKLAPTDKVTLGKRISNTQLFVLGDAQELLPFGAKGELYIGGVGLARGYVNLEAQTAQAFIDNPYYMEGNSNSSLRLYRTGDIVRYDQDGLLEYMGRKDEQVKVRGVRVELSSIESQLEQLSGVDSSAVVTAELAGMTHLIAYIKPSCEVAALDELVYLSAVKKELYQLLPQHLIPSQFIMVKAWPLTSNGKLNKKLLPDVSVMGSCEGVYEASSDSERRLQQLYGELLSIDPKQVSTTANFFALGGYSLMATRMVNRVRAEFSKELPLTELFKLDTLAEVAEYLDKQMPLSNGFAYYLSHRAELEENQKSIVEQGDELKLASFVQQRIWFMEKMVRGSTQYNIQQAFELNGDVNYNAVKLALTEVVCRHEVFEHSFTQVSDSLYLRSGKFPDFVVAEVDLGSLPAIEQELRLQELIKNDSMQSFNLEQDRLIRAKLIRCSNERVVMLLNVHHIIFDGWSLTILFNEFKSIYNNLVADAPNNTQVAQVQYHDYVAWQRHLVDIGVYESQLNFWCQRLAGIPSCHSLPLDFRRPTKVCHKGMTFTYRINQASAVKLSDFCSTRATTPFSVMQSIFALLLHRYSYESDIVMGTPVSGRTQVELELVIGMFVNTVVLRTNFSRSMSLSGLVTDSQSMILDALSNQDIPFDLVVDALNPARGANISPVFQILFSMLDVNNDAEMNDGLQVSLIKTQVQEVKCDLELAIERSDNYIDCSWSFKTSLFKESSIRLMAQALDSLLNYLLDDPEKSVDDISFNQGIVVNNDSCDSSYHAPKYDLDPIVSQFDKQVETNPDAIAVEYMEQTLRYCDLARKVNELARYIIETGIKPGEMVGLCFERSTDLVAAIIAVMKAGCTYVPLDSASPISRLQYIIEDSGLSTILTHTQVHQGLFDGLQVNLVNLTELNIAAEKMTHSSLPEVNLNDMAYVIYTSGSTGRPKGVSVSHENVASLMAASKKEFNFCRSDVWTLFHSYAFDFSVWEIWGALTTGGKLVVVPSICTKSAQHFYQFLVDQRVTVLNQTPSAFYRLIEDMKVNQSKQELSVRYVIFGGEKLNPMRVANWFESAGTSESKLINMYGITETTVHVTYHEVTKQELSNNISNIGKPLEHLNCYIVNTAGAAQPTGAWGELLVGGLGVTNGYLNNSELTSTKFIANRFDNSSEKLYRTGDIVRQLESGELEYLGRADTQVKLRGYRIETGEIEAHLLTAEGVKEAAVAIIDDVLIGFYVLEQKALKVNASMLRNHLANEVPTYMVPSSFIELEEMPLTVNGKLNLDKLARQFSAYSMEANRTQMVAPSSDIERMLCDIWERVFCLKSVGIEDNFFELGGDSIRIVQIIMEAEKLGLSLSIEQVYGHQTIRELANQCQRFPIEALQKFLPLHYLPEGAPFETVYPVSAMQKTMLNQHQDGKGIYHPVMYFELKNVELNIEALESALRALINKHPVFGTRFYQACSGEFVQRIEPNVLFQVEVEDLSVINGLPQCINSILAEELEHEFELGELCFRFRVFKHSCNDWGIAFCSHHAIVDGWGLSRFLGELVMLYEQYSRGLEVIDVVPSYPPSLEHLALEMEARQNSDHNVAWRKLLANYRQMPALEPSNKEDGRNFEELWLTLSKDMLIALKQRSTSHKAELKLLVLNAYFATLSRVLKSDTVTIDVVSSGRSNRLSDPLNAMGLFWAFLPVVHQLTGNERQDLQSLSDTIWQSNEHSLYPYDCISSLVEPKLDSLTCASFNFVNFHSVTASNADFEVTQRYVSDRFHHDIQLAVSVSEQIQNISLQLTFNVNVFSSQQAEQLLNELYNELAIN